MKKIRNSILLILLAIAAVVTAQAIQAPALTAASDEIPDPAPAYLILAEFDGIPGESMINNYENWIDVQSFTFSMSKPPLGATGMSRRRGNVVFEDIVMTKWVDKATPKLMEAAALGSIIPTVEVHFIKLGASQEYYKYELVNVMVTSVTSTGHVEEYIPTDTLTLNFEEITVTYSEFDGSGNHMGDIIWNLEVEEGEA
jgi:type VI secretion system secreted protein Hcp